APSDDELRIELTADELPTARVSGRVVDVDNRPVTAHLVITHHAFPGQRMIATDTATGTFDLGPVIPGCYTMIVEAPSFGRTPLRVLEVAAGEHRVLDDLVLQPAGRVEIALAENEPERTLLRFVRDDGAIVAHTMTQGRTATVELPPGDYLASVALGRFAGSTAPFRVRPRALTRCRLACLLTSPVVLMAILPEPVHGGRRIDVLIRDEGGSLVDAQELSVYDDDEVARQIRLPPGRFLIDCRSTDGAHASAAVTVRSDGGQAPVRLELR
ncbi:MAG: carboxypeptidase regulatory-like domain-containing protein, partial [Planctomycetes bacterium]|nr:carboxypeptidase regulatory-like domain-containing protein [Planctomycetota bacterium]